MTPLLTAPERIEAESGLQIGLGGWSCRLSADTPAGTAALAHWFGRYRIIEPAPTACEIRLALHEPGRPCITVSDGYRTFSFADVAAGPEWRRFSSLPDGSGRFADLLLGPRAVLQVQSSGTAVLEPRLWPLYVSVAWQWLMLQQRQLCCLHAAVVACRGIALVLIGPSGTGKSTLSRALQAAGADYYGDDGAYFSLPEFHLFPLVRDLCLRPGGLEALGGEDASGSWHELKPGDPKCVVSQAAPERRCPESRMRLFFLDGFAERPELQPIQGAEAARRLFGQLACGTASLAERLRLAGDLANRYPGQRLAIGTPQATADLLLRLVEAC